MDPRAGRDRWRLVCMASLGAALVLLPVIGRLAGSATAQWPPITPASDVVLAVLSWGSVTVAAAAALLWARGLVAIRSGEGAEARLERRRADARWHAAMGFAFVLAGFSPFTRGRGLGQGAILVGVWEFPYGALAMLTWAWVRRRRRGDPWAYDPELDGAGAPPEFRP